MPPKNDGVWRTYTNVVYANGVLLVPIYPGTDEQGQFHALATFAELLPGWRIVGVNSNKLIEFDGVRILGEAYEKCPLLSFVIDSVHAQDVAILLDQEGVAVRAGHHCTQPLWDHFDVAATVRASFGVYNDRDDIDRFVESMDKVRRIFNV